MFGKMKKAKILIILSILSPILQVNSQVLGAALTPVDKISFDSIVENDKVGDLTLKVAPYADQNGVLTGDFGIKGEFKSSTNESYADFLQNTLNGAIGINWLQIWNIEPNFPGLGVVWRGKKGKK